MRAIDLFGWSGEAPLYTQQEAQASLQRMLRGVKVRDVMEADPAERVRRRMEQSPELLRLGPEAVLYAILDEVVDELERSWAEPPSELGPWSPPSGVTAPSAPRTKRTRVPLLNAARGRQGR